ncbi:MAG: restriction endonuclease subunit S [Oribacterium sp.]|nr:restriction endonuclease subunit S [Oribacterium sp.]
MGRQMKDSGINWIGSIPRNWSLAELKYFSKVNNGKEIEIELNEDDEAAIPVYGSGGVFKFTNNYLYDGVSVMFGRKGTLGKPLYVKGKFWTVDTMYYLTYTGKMNPKYNYYE